MLVPDSRDLPAVVTVGGYEFQHRLPRLVRELESGAIVHVVSLQAGRHRGWFDADRPGGCEPARRTVSWLQHNIGKAMDDVRDGGVYEIHDAGEDRVFGYLYWAAPDWLAALGDVSLQYSHLSRAGQVVYRDMFPLACEAEPVSPRRRGVLAHA